MTGRLNHKAHFLRDELLFRVNAWTQRRYGITVTARMLRDLVDEDLIDGPTPKGRERGTPPEWQWSRATFWLALWICWLRYRGLKRNSQIRAALWLSHANIDFKLVRKSILQEFRVALRQLYRSISSIYDPRSDEWPDKGKQALLNQMGAVSPGLWPEGSEPTTDHWIAGYGAIRFGEPHESLNRLFEALLSAVIPSATVQFASERPSFSASDILLGLGGASEEIEKSAEESIACANERAFETARAMTNALPQLLSTASRFTEAFAVGEFSKQLRGTFSRIANSLKDFRWRLATFVSFLHLAHQKGDEVEKYWNDLTASLNPDLQLSSESEAHKHGY